MSQLSAYELLQHYQQVYGISTVKSNALQEVYIYQPIQKDSDSRATFIQFYNKDEIQTEIGTMSVPNALECNRNISILQQIFGDSEVTLYQVNHCQNTVNVSYSCELGAYIITSQGATIICQDDKQIEQQLQQYTQRVCEVAQYFFYLLKRMHPKLRQCFSQDLTNRTLVGVSCFKHLYWFGLIEHYDSQKIMNLTIVRDFLTHYNLDFVKVRKRDKVKIGDLKNIYNEVYNTYIDNFNDMNKESTFYIWRDNKFLGSFCIPHKHYLVIQAFKNQWRNNIQNPYAYLSDFNLSQNDIRFYQKYTDLMLISRQDQLTFSTLTSVVFNCILLKKSLKERITFRYSLAHCINPTVVVLIPIGLSRGGFELLFDSLNYPFTRMIKSCEDISLDCQICCLNHFYPPSKYEEIQNQCEKYNFRVITIGLYHDSVIQKGNCKFPFSLPYLASCLSTHTNESLIETITYLKLFQNFELKKLPFNLTIPCILLPRDQETYLSQNEKLIQNLENFILGKEDQISNLREQGDLYSSININYYREESLQLLQQIEQKTGIELNRVGWPQPRQQNESIIFIEKQNWEKIEDHTCDCIEIICRKFQKENPVNEMFQQLKGQFFENREELYKRNTKNIRMDIGQKQSFEVQVRIAIVVVDGIIIYIPEDVSSKEGIPIYTRKLDIQDAENIVQQVNSTITKFQQPTVSEKSVVLQQITINNIQWAAYVVKLYPILIKLEVKRSSVL